MSTPILSVVVPTFGRTEPLYRLLRSLASQTLLDLDVTLVDQNPPGFLDEAQLRASPLRLEYLHVARPNASAARNAGFAASSGAYVLFLDDDELPDATFCARAVDALAGWSEVRCLSPVVYDEGGTERAVAHFRGRSTGRELAGTPFFELRTAGSGGILFEREYFQRSGGFDELLFDYARMSEDAELVARMRQRGLTVWCDPTLHLFHDMSPTGGCEIRSEPYREIRVRAARASTFLGRIRNGRPFAMGARDVMEVVRYVLLSSLGRPDGRGQIVRHPLWHLRLMLREMRGSKLYIERHGDAYADPARIDHLRPYDERRWHGPGAVERTGDESRAS